MSKVSHTSLDRQGITDHVANLGGPTGEEENDIAATAASVLILRSASVLADFKWRCKSKSCENKTRDEALHFLCCVQ